MAVREKRLACGLTQTQATELGVAVAGALQDFQRHGYHTRLANDLLEIGQAVGLDVMADEEDGR